VDFFIIGERRFWESAHWRNSIQSRLHTEENTRMQRGKEMRLQWLGFATTSFFSALMLWTYFLTISVENFEACSMGYLSEMAARFRKCC
jgi:hypothetical protein